MTRPHSHLRDYQKYIKTHVLEAWKSHKSIMLQMPTGTGKTHLLASIIYDSLKRMGNGVSGLWHTAAKLVEQIEETMERYGIPSIPKEDGRVRAMSIQWLSRHLADFHESPNLIVIDGRLTMHWLKRIRSCGYVILRQKIGLDGYPLPDEPQGIHGLV